MGVDSKFQSSSFEGVHCNHYFSPLAATHAPQFLTRVHTATHRVACRCLLRRPLCPSFYASSLLPSLPLLGVESEGRGEGTSCSGSGSRRQWLRGSEGEREREVGRLRVEQELIERAEREVQQS